MSLKVSIIELADDHAWIEIEHPFNHLDYLEIRVDVEEGDEANFEAPFVSKRNLHNANVVQELPRRWEKR